MSSFFKKSPEVRRELILNGKILNTLVILSLPTIIMALVQSMVPIVDGYFLNNYGGILVASAVTFSLTVINIANGLSLGLGAAGMALIGQYNGRGDVKRVVHISEQLFFFAIALGFIMAPVLFFIAWIISKNVNQEVAPYIFKYLSNYSYVLPMLFLAAVYNGIKNAMGQPEATLIRMVMLLILKICFNYLYLEVMNWGVFGAAFSSFSTYSVIMIWLVYDLFIKKSDFKLSIRGFKFDWPQIRQIIKIGAPSMLSSMFVFLGFFLINMEVQSYGPKILNAQGIASGINALAFTVPSSISATVTTMVSMNVGNNNEKKAKLVYKKALLFGIFLSLLIIIYMVTYAKKLVLIFQRTTNDPFIIETATRALNIYTYSVLGFAPFMITQGTCIGLGRTKIPLFMGLLRIWGFRYIFILLTRARLGVYSVFWGNLFSNFMAAIIFAIILKNLPFKSVIMEE